MTRKILLSLGIFLSLIFTFSTISFANDCCFESVTVLNTGVVSEQEVQIEGRLLTSSYVQSNQGIKYQSDHIIEVTSDNQPVECRSAITNEAGYFLITCESSSPGSYTVQVKPFSINEDVGQSFSVSINFNTNSGTGSPTPTPSVSPSPTTEPSPSASVQPSATPSPSPDLSLVARIQELEAKVAAQAEKISVLESLIQQLTDWFHGLSE